MRSLVPLVAFVGLTSTACNESCGEDESVTADGCVPVATVVPWDEDTLPGYRLPACVIDEPGDGRVDFEHGCGAGVCRSDTYATFASTLGQPDDVEDIGSSVRVEWEDTVTAYFDDEDNNSRPDDTSLPGLFSVDGRAAGSTDSGLRVAHSFACFVQELGQPDDIDLDNGRLEWLRWRIPDVSIVTHDGNGYVDRLFL